MAQFAGYAKSSCKALLSQIKIDGLSKMSEESLNPPLQLSDLVQAALNLPNGTRFYRCAFQVNPYAYLAKNGTPTTFNSEDDYNTAIVEKCIEIGIDVIAVTDHYCVKDSTKLVRLARKEGLFAFGGFEAVAKDGVHFLCLFDPTQDEKLERYIGNCGIHDIENPSKTGSLDSTELLERAKSWGAACIAAHVASKGGLLATLSGDPGIQAWTDQNLLACALPGPVDAAQERFRPILKNKNDQYKRDRLPAILNASDVNGPTDLDKTSTSCFIKMSTISTEALRQAFLDPDSRVRLHSDPRPEPHAEFLAITWEGGFLRDSAVHFNENLNVLVGGRGTGKSTVIESIRYVLGLEPLGQDAKKVHEGMIRDVLKSGTKVSLLVQSHKPSKRIYSIERSVPNPPVVKDDSGNVLALAPSDVMPNVELYGQHEISELTKSPEKLTFLLDRFVTRESSFFGRKSNVRLELERSRRRIVEIQREMTRLDEQLALLPALEETQTRFQEAGLEERLKERSLLIREERLFVSIDERLDQYRAIHRELVDSLPIDTAFVSEKALEGLPNATILVEGERALIDLNKKLASVNSQFGDALNEAEQAISSTKSTWSEHKTSIEETYEQLLRELQKSKIDGEEFIRLRQQIEALRPLNDKMKDFRRDLEANETERRNLLSEWDDIKSTEYRQVEAAAKRVTRKLAGTVRATVMMAGDRSPLRQLLLENLGGNFSVAINRLCEHDQLSLIELASLGREGKDALIERYGVSDRAAERIAGAELELFMLIEEMELPATTEIELNTAADGESQNWQTLEALSTGQKATAVLLLLLLESEAPLIVDQPEDDLDNRFITDGVVPIMREAKRKRQFVFSTHNANIPVLGDAELILGLSASGVAEDGKARIDSKHMASIDSGPVRELVEEILEGGKAAFEMRRSKYGF